MPSQWSRARRLRRRRSHLSGPAQIGDPTVGAAASPSFRREVISIGDLIADEGLGPVVEVREENLVCSLAGRHDVAVRSTGSMMARSSGTCMALPALQGKA